MSQLLNVVTLVLILLIYNSTVIDSYNVDFMTILYIGGHMNSFKNALLVIIAIFVIVFSFSCDNNATFTGSEVVIEEPSFVAETSGGKSLGKATTNITKYMVSMIPQWISESYAIVGDTRKGQDPNDENYGFIIVSKESLNKLGYFSQGLWSFTLRAYAKDAEGNEVPVYEVKKTVEINSNSTSIEISASDVTPINKDALCTINLCNFVFFATGPISEYGNENSLGMKLTYKVTDLSTQNVICSEKDIASNSISADSNLKGVVRSLKIGDSFTSGAYSLSIYLNEYVGGNWVHTGGTSISFVAIPGIEINILGDANEIDLCRYDYKDISSGGIVVDSGVSSTVSVKAYNSSNTEITSATVGQTVTFKAEIKEIIDENTSNPITSSSYKWFVDGVEQEGTSINSGNLSFTPTTAKTCTITYMFLDGTNYNTISGNCYLTVTAS